MAKELEDMSLEELESLAASENIQLADQEIKVGPQEDDLESLSLEELESMAADIPTRQAPSRDLNATIAEQRLQERGPLDIPSIGRRLKGGSLSDRIVAGIEGAAIPFRVTEAAVANPLLQVIKGETGAKEAVEGFRIGGPVGAVINPIFEAQDTGFENIPSSVVEALKGKRLGEFGDVYTGLGADEATAATLGFTTDVALGAGILKGALKTIRKGFLKKGDKAALSALDDFGKGLDRAEEASKQVVNSFWKGIDDVKVNPAKIVESESFNKLPKSAISIIEEELGKNIEEISNLADIRKVKQTLGVLKSNAFGKAERGLQNTLDERKVKKAYGFFSNLINDTLNQAGRGKDAAKLQEVNAAAEEVIKASKIIRGELKTAKGKERIQTLISQTSKLSGAPFRKNLTTLAKQSKKAEKLFTKSVQTLNKIAFRESMKRTAGNIVKFGLTGAVAGKVLQSGVRTITGGN